MVKKAILAVVIICTIGLGARAQKIIYGAKIAGGFAYQQIKNPEILSTGDIRTFNIKGIAQLPMKHNFWLEAGLGIMGKGGVFYQDALTTTVRTTYLELPLSVMRKFNFTDLGVFYLGAGGYVARGLGGKIDYETPGSKSTDQLKFGKNNDVARYGTGLEFTSGFEFRNQVTFNIGFDLGLNNIASSAQQATATSVVRNREFTVGLGYLLK